MTEWLLMAAGVVLLLLCFGRRRGSYAAYLASPQWKRKRAAALKRDGWRCRVCNSGRHLEVHHRRYPRVLGTESVDDLSVLCAPCHSVVSKCSWVPGNSR